MPPPSLPPERAKVAESYSAGSGTIPPLPWQTFPPPFSRGGYHVRDASHRPPSGPVVEAKNEAEAELRHAATRLRQNALHGGDRRQRGGSAAALGTALEQVIAQWRHLCAQLMRTTLISHGNSFLRPFVGLIMCAPKYLADAMSLGEVTQAAAAFTIQAAFNWLVDNYPRLADWRSSVHRVAALLVSLDAVDDLEPSAHSGSLPPSRLKREP